VYIYEAPLFPGVEPVIRKVPLYSLPSSGISAISTLYIPPSVPRGGYRALPGIGSYQPSISVPEWQSERISDGLIIGQ